VHQENHFSFGPIKEVAWLFSASSPPCCRPWITWRSTGRKSPSPAPPIIICATGALSSVLDNAPTYVNFLKLAQVRSAAHGQ